MRLAENTKRRIRYILLTLTIICLAVPAERSCDQSEVQTRNKYLYRDLTCAIDLGDNMYSSNSLETGLNYELIKQFAKDNRCKVRIITTSKNTELLDSLRQGKIDLLITHHTDSIHLEGVQFIDGFDDCVWMAKASDKQIWEASERWIRHMVVSSRYDELENRFSSSYKPRTNGGAIRPSNRVSPYDDLFRKYSEDLGWDWRLVAAVVYLESRFSINSRSSRGAVGLMQVMPKTGEYYGVSDLEDPEQNIMVGTRHLKRLKQMFAKWDLEPEELTKFTLAGYNAGEGRVIDCRKFAQAKGYDSRKWEEIKKVIPMMSDNSILSDTSIVHGKFNGGETISYVESVMSHYQAICQMCPKK